MSNSLEKVKQWRDQNLAEIKNLEPILTRMQASGSPAAEHVQRLIDTLRSQVAEADAAIARAAGR
jgi:hypothetical protein